MKTYCPYCQKETEYGIVKREVKEFRGVSIDTYENVGICKKCHNDLFINKLEEENNNRIYGEYRKKANIILPQDIVNLRKKYNISQRELTSILGFGKMTINRYERGGIPTKSQSDYLRFLIDNDNKFIEKAKEAYDNKQINKKTLDKVTNVNNGDEDDKDFIHVLKLELTAKLKRDPDIYNGYQTLDLDKLENIVSYIASKANLTITSLNKYLWFIDMLSFKERGISITGLTYQNQKYGPTIIDNQYDVLSLLNDKYKREDIETETGNCTRIISKENYNLESLDESEKEIIDTIIKKLKNKKVNEISNLSHQEDGWKKTKRFEKISFEYAKKLKLVD